MAGILKQGRKNNLFLSSKDGNYTYGDLHTFTRYFEVILQRHNVNKRKPVGLCANSSDELIFIIAACWLQGIPFAPINPDSPEATLSDQIIRLEPSLIITDESNPTPDSVHSINIDNINLEQVLSENSISSGQSFDESGSRDIKKENIFGYFFTSGTSGSPKVVPLKRRQMISAARSSAQNFHSAANELWLLCLPLYHIGGISVILRSVLYGSGIYRTDGFDTLQAGQLLSQNRKIVAVSLVPTMLKRLMESDSFDPHPQLKGVLLGGGPISPDLLASCIERNIPVIPSYGMTETCAQIAANPLFSFPEHPETLHSAGTVFEPNRVEIRDGEGLPVKSNRSGLIWLKGPQVFDGYLDKSQDTFDNKDWFHTGDFGRFDAEGRLFIEARRTDLIISGGENVSPFEVEQALKAIHGIRDAAVMGLPDEEWGQKVVAVVVFEENKRQPESELQKMLKKKLASFKVPKVIIHVNSLPRTETGKIKRSELLTVFKSNP